MQKKLFGFALFLLLAIFSIIAFPTFAQTGLQIAGQPSDGPKETYEKATVTQITHEGNKQIGTDNNFYQDVTAQVDSGNTISLEYGGITKIDPSQKLRIGDELVVLSSTLPGKTTEYHILDRYRLTPLPFLIIGFFILVIAFGGKRGIGSIIGMLVSLGVIMLFIVPQILSGNDPLLISIIGELVIMVITIYLSHGFSRQTTVAVFSTFLSLLITGVLAIYTVKLLGLSGTGNEDNASLAFGASFINLQGLLLGGIIIGTLGVLDDTTTTQASAVFEFARIDHKLSFEQLLQKGLNIGKEHIAALVNTLVLAYAGVSLSLFIFFVLNPAKQPYWVIFNSESIVEEVVRTITGSIGLVLAVPLTTALAAWVAKFSIKSQNPYTETSHPSKKQ
jgi:uncharacterized membrane protein